jgi:ABC-type nitrate/sulfonate/bicarbonate transport system permease component
MIQRESYLDTSGIVLIVLIYCACALILDRVIKVAEQKLLPWAESHATGGAAGAVLGLEL